MLLLLSTRSHIFIQPIRVCPLGAHFGECVKNYQIIILISVIEVIIANIALSNFTSLFVRARVGAGVDAETAVNDMPIQLCCQTQTARTLTQMGMLKWAVT